MLVATLREFDIAVATARTGRVSPADAEHALPDDPGLYAVWGLPEAWADLGLSTEGARAGRPLYVGKSESSLRARDARTHLRAGRTGHSTLRRSLAGLLHATGAIGPLHARPRNPRRPERFANFALTDHSERELQAWVAQHLRIGWWSATSTGENLVAVPPLKDLERGLLAHRSWASSPPPLNLKDVGGATTAGVREIKAARRVLADQARAWVPEDVVLQREPVVDDCTYDLIDLFRAEERGRRTPDLERRRDPLALALGLQLLPRRDAGPGIDLDEGHGRSPDELFADDTFAWFLRGAVARIDAAASPFDGLLEAPMPVPRLYSGHAEHLRAVAEPWAAALRALVLGGLAMRYGVPADSRTSRRRVREAEEDRDDG